MVTTSTSLIQAVIDVFIGLWNCDFFTATVLILVSIGIMGMLLSLVHIILVRR